VTSALSSREGDVHHGCRPLGLPVRSASHFIRITGGSEQVAAHRDWLPVSGDDCHFMGVALLCEKVSVNVGLVVKDQSVFSGTF